MSYYSTRNRIVRGNNMPLTAYLVEKNAALPPKEQTRAIVAHGEKKKKGLSTGAKLVGGGALLALGLGTGKIQHAAKMLGKTMKNPTTNKFDPVGSVTRGWRDMGNTAGSTKAVQNSESLMKKSLEGKGAVHSYTGAQEGANFGRRSGLLSKGNKFEGVLNAEAQANVTKQMQKEFPDLFKDGKMVDFAEAGIDGEKAIAAHRRMVELAKAQELGTGTALQRANLGMYLPGEKAVIGGLTGMGAAGELSTTHDPNGRKRSLGERLIRAGGVGAAGIALNPLFANPKAGLIGGMLAFEAGNRITGAGAGLAGRGVTAASGGEYGSPVQEVRSHIPFAGGGH